MKNILLTCYNKILSILKSDESLLKIQNKEKYNLFDYSIAKNKALLLSFLYK